MFEWGKNKQKEQRVCALVRSLWPFRAYKGGGHIYFWVIGFITRIGVGSCDEVDRSEENDDFNEMADGGNVKEGNDEPTGVAGTEQKPTDVFATLHFLPNLQILLRDH